MAPIPMKIYREAHKERKGLLQVFLRALCALAVIICTAVPTSAALLPMKLERGFSRMRRILAEFIRFDPPDLPNPRAIV